MHQSRPLVSWMNHLLIPFSLYLARCTEATTVIFDSDDETDGDWPTDVRRGAPGEKGSKMKSVPHASILSTDQVIFLSPYSSFSYIWLSKPINALAHPKFRKMINIASCAPDSINIPSRKQTQAEILNTFKTHLIQLQKHLNVSLIYYPVPPLSNQYFYYKPGLQAPLRPGLDCRQALTLIS